MDEASLLELIAAAPRDIDHRRVYADWLEDRHDPRAAVLRAQIRVLDATEGSSSVRRAAILAACAEVDPSWLAQIDLAPIENCPRSPKADCPGRWETLPREPLATLTRRCPVCAASVRYHTAPPRTLASGAPIAVLSAAERHPGEAPVLRPPPTYAPQPLYTNPSIPYPRPPPPPSPPPSAPVPSNPPRPADPQTSPEPSKPTPRWWRFW